MFVFIEGEEEGQTAFEVTKVLIFPSVQLVLGTLNKLHTLAT